MFSKIKTTQKQKNYKKIKHKKINTGKDKGNQGQRIESPEIESCVCYFMMKMATE